MSFRKKKEKAPPDRPAPHYQIVISYRIEGKAAKLTECAIPHVAEGEGQSTEFNMLVVAEVLRRLARARVGYLKKEEAPEFGRMLNLLLSDIVGEFHDPKPTGDDAALEGAMRLLDAICLLNGITPSELAELSADGLWDAFAAAHAKREEIKELEKEKKDGVQD